MADYPITVQRICSSCKKEFSTVTTLTGADKYGEVDAMMKEDCPKCEECGEPSLIIVPRFVDVPLSSFAMVPGNILCWTREKPE